MTTPPPKVYFWAFRLTVTDLFMDKNIKTDKDDLKRKISESLEQQTKVNPYVDIKTWEERRNQPGRKLPEKELLGWF